jgi:hypothetical protein
MTRGLLGRALYLGMTRGFLGKGLYLEFPEVYWEKVFT